MRRKMVYEPERIQQFPGPRSTLWQFRVIEIAWKPCLDYTIWATIGRIHRSGFSHSKFWLWFSHEGNLISTAQYTKFKFRCGIKKFSTFRLVYSLIDHHSIILNEIFWYCSFCSRQNAFVSWIQNHRGLIEESESWLLNIGLGFAEASRHHM